MAAAGLAQWVGLPCSPPLATALLAEATTGTVPTAAAAVGKLAAAAASVSAAVFEAAAPAK
eukprot:scaffold31367_cov160-Isochrysis_galbana.AAC.1